MNFDDCFQQTRQLYTICREETIREKETNDCVYIFVPRVMFYFSILIPCTTKTIQKGK